MKLPDKVYNVLKWIVLILLPALATLYYGIATVWGLNIYAEQVVGTISIVETFLGTIIGISTYNYNKGKALDELEEKFDMDVATRTIGKATSSGNVSSAKNAVIKE